MTTKTAMEMLEEIQAKGERATDKIMYVDAPALDAAISQLRKEQAAMIPRAEVERLLEDVRSFCNADGYEFDYVDTDDVYALLAKYPQEPK